MSEFIRTQNNPFDNIQHEEFRLLHWTDLSPEQALLIAEGPGWIENPASSHLTRFDSLESFTRHVGKLGMNTYSKSYNNFKCFLYPRGSFGTEFYSSVPAFQRFHIIYPELVDHIDSKMTELDYKPAGDIWQDLYISHSLMRRLVDRDDPKVINRAGELNPGYLLR